MPTSATAGAGPLAPDPTVPRTLEHLRELVVALDRRVPHLERSGEADVARVAAALRFEALQRIAELEGSAS